MPENNNDNSKSGGSPALISREADTGLVILLAIFLLFQLIANTGRAGGGGIVAFLGFNPQNPKSIYTSMPVSSTTPVGVRVRAREQLSVFDSPAGTIIGWQPKNAVGRIVSGPEFAAGEYWRDIDFATSTDGWVRQDLLMTYPPAAIGSSRVVSIFTTVSTLISLLLLAGIVYSTVRIREIRKREREEMEAMTRRALRSQRSSSNQRWDHVIDHIESPNESDWRTAILEADVMLNEMMEAMGYNQDTLGEKLKAVEKSDFTNIEKAWEAHKARNKIAHEGREYALTQREAQRIVGLYEDVFREFSYI